MELSWENIASNATSFAHKWEAREGKEKQQAQMFVNDFLACFGITDPIAIGEYEHKCPKEVGDDGYIDFFAPSKIIIEMKTAGRSLDKAFTQVKDYVIHLESHEMPELIMVSDFNEIILYHRTTAKRTAFKTKDLKKHVKKFAVIAGRESARTYDNQIEVNIKAAEKMAKLHDALKDSGYDGHELEVYLVRLLFCLFADDTGIFPQDSFLNYLENSKEDGSDVAQRLAHLFEVLNMPNETRKKRINLSADLLEFRYINGGLFKDRLAFADFNNKMRITLIDCCKFDWNKISPAIFGSMFQGVMSEKLRRELGAHYTSEENILKLINPLFMDDLWKEFEEVKSISQKLEAFHKKIASLKFLDPACGCGNFLIITYRELRLLELEVLKMKVNTKQAMLDIGQMLKVSIEQFYGIEYEDFPSQITQVGMWLIDHQMNLRVAELFGQYYAHIPLTQSVNIFHGNALTTDWKNVVPKAELNYIIGNPPFVGARLMSNEQKTELMGIFSNIKNAGNLDYVCCWYKKAIDYMKNTTIQTAFVSTNSICQGEQVANLWKPLFDKGIYINFAYRTFTWSNEAKGKAAVYCIIVAFSYINKKNSLIVLENGQKTNVREINAYLCATSPIFIYSRQKPICDIPPIGIGNKPIDGGNYLFTAEEKDQFIKKEPNSEKWFRPWIGAHEFINGYFRYCLFLKHCPLNELKKMPECLKRIEEVKQFRLGSKSAPTQKLAEYPLSFHVENMPLQNYLLIPRVSSEKRVYIPIGFLDKNIISSDSVHIIPNATFYHFAILTSCVHMAWMRAVAGRLELRYRYSKDIVYNNFPWAEISETDKEKLEQLAQAILDARKLYPDSSLASLYDPLVMPQELKKAHQNLDKAVMKYYGYKTDITEAEIVADLMARYKELVEK